MRFKINKKNLTKAKIKHLFIKRNKKINIKDTSKKEISIWNYINNIDIKGVV